MWRSMPNQWRSDLGLGESTQLNTRHVCEIVDQSVESK